MVPILLAIPFLLPSQSAREHKAVFPEGLDSEIIHSKRLNGGVPLGGIGCGAFDLMTDGSIGRLSINNNRDQPIESAPGSFAAVWTRSGAYVLQLVAPYGLPAVQSVDFLGLFPEAFVDFSHPAPNLHVSLRAYSSLIPHDLKNSAIPAAILAFTIENESAEATEAAIAVSWENLLGVGGTASAGKFADRTGNTVQRLPDSPGFYGVKLGAPLQPPSAPDNRFRYNARGDYTLMCRPTDEEMVLSQAGWNALDKKPGWWDSFARDGTVSGTVGAGVEGSVHPAAVVAVKAKLKSKEAVVIPFAVAWHTPRQWAANGIEYGHFYEKSFDDSAAVARYALDNRDTLLALTDEWQHAMIRSSLLPGLKSKLINDLSPLFSNTVLTRQGSTEDSPGLFGMLGETDGPGKMGDPIHRLTSSPALSEWFPELDLQELRQYRALQADNGAMPGSYGNIDTGFLAPQSSLAEQPVHAEAISAYIALVYRRYRMTADQAFLDDFYPSAKHAIEYAATLDTNGSAMWLAALRIGEKLAQSIKDQRFAEQCHAWYEKAYVNAKGSLAGPTALPGLWMAADAEGEEIPSDGPIANELLKTASWHYLEAVQGFNLNLPDGRLMLAPRLPTGWTSISAPIYLPTITGRMEYVLGQKRAHLLFRVDRYFSRGMTSTKNGPGPGLTIKQVILPAIAGLTQVVASVGRSPLPGKLDRDSHGRLTFTADSPITLTAGQRIEFTFKPAQ